MNKVVCHICGTSYPENVSQCPICGFSRSSDSSGETRESAYSHVPGGRFSKSNVRKRNKVKQKKAIKAEPVETPVKKSKEKTGAGLVIVVILLLLAILAVVGYIALRFFLPNDYIFEGFDNLFPAAVTETLPVTEPEQPTEPEQTETEPMPVLCEQIILDQTVITADSIGSVFQLTYQLTPADTDEEVTFTSSDTTVATVDVFGLVTVHAEGSATISAMCGSASATCEINCVLPTEEPTEDVQTLTLNRKELTFDAEGQSWLLYDGPLSVDEIVWTSDDNKVATIEAGKVFAVAEGDTVVYGIYNGQTVSCTIHCKFDSEDATEETRNVSEAGDGSKNKYKLYNPHGYADDVTTTVGKEFKLRLVDEYKNTVSDVEWTVENPEVCSYKDGVVKALSAGTTKVIAKYQGHSYVCIVRVNKK